MVTRQILFFSVVSIIVGLLFWRAGRRILARGKLSEATIVKNVFSPNEITRVQKAYGIDDDESGTYYPVIQFMTVENELITIQLSIGFNPPRSVGGKLPIVYNPSDPNDIMIYPRIQLEVIPKMLVSVGVIGFIVVMLDIFELVSVLPN